ncbi:MAG: class I SAM-dependent methyltransferase [Candidatus Omnitrophica bacterium]|nr:class I SAM-dependent methyltransferase [Candidatus Omnitrophota bacterium]
MINNISAFTINNPVFVRIKKKFNWAKLTYEQSVKAVYINERIIELPFVIQGLAGLKRGGKVLDVGCSESILPMQLAGLGYAVTGLDFRYYPFHFPGLGSCQSDATKMPFENGSFDAVTCVSMLEHVGIGHYDDPWHDDSGDTKVMGEIARVLQKDGLILLTVPFGVPTQGSLQRTYDPKRLEKILSGWRVEEKRYFINAQDKGALNDHWQECDEAKAATMNSVDKTVCVCLLKARRS